MRKTTPFAVAAARMRASLLHIAIGTFAMALLSGSIAYAQSVKPRSPGEIAAASNHIAQRNEDCRRQAREQHLHLIRRYLFMRDCKRRPFTQSARVVPDTGQRQ